MKPRGVEGEKPRRLSVVSGTRELRAAAPRNGNRERGSLDYDEGVRLFRLGQSLTQGAEPERRTRASGAVGEPGLVDRLGNDGS